MYRHAARHVDLTFDSDVTIESCSDEGTQHSQHVAHRLPRIGRDAQVRRVLNILSLVAVHEQPVNHVTNVNEELRSPHSLEEVTRSFHLGHKFDEDHGTAICVDCLHESVDSSPKVASVR